MFVFSQCWAIHKETLGWKQKWIRIYKKNNLKKYGFFYVYEILWTCREARCWLNVKYSPCVKWGVYLLRWASTQRGKDHAYVYKIFPNGWEYSQVLGSAVQQTRVEEEKANNCLDICVLNISIFSLNRPLGRLSP